MIANLQVYSKVFRKSKTVKVYVNLLEEGVPTLRPTQAVPLGNDIYKLLPAIDYDPNDEIWEFLPNSIVRCELKKTFRHGLMPVAVEKIG